MTNLDDIIFNHLDNVCTVSADNWAEKGPQLKPSIFDSQRVEFENFLISKLKEDLTEIRMVLMQLYSCKNKSKYLNIIENELVPLIKDHKGLIFH